MDCGESEENKNISVHIFIYFANVYLLKKLLKKKNSLKNEKL